MLHVDRFNPSGLLFDEQARRELIAAAGAELRAMRAELEEEGDLRSVTPVTC